MGGDNSALGVSRGDVRGLDDCLRPSPMEAGLGDCVGLQFGREAFPRHRLVGVAMTTDWLNWLRCKWRGHSWCSPKIYSTGGEPAVVWMCGRCNKTQVTG
jgi:hypothetical protein